MKTRLSESKLAFPKALANGKVAAFVSMMRNTCNAKTHPDQNVTIRYLTNEIAQVGETWQRSIL